MSNQPTRPGPLPPADLTVDERLAAAAHCIAVGEQWLAARQPDLAQAASALADSHLSLVAVAADHGPPVDGPPVGFGAHR